MKKHSKFFACFLIIVMALTTMAGGVFAEGGNGGGGSPTNEDPPELNLTKFRPKEATEYIWEVSGTFSPWIPSAEEGMFETQMDLYAVREKVQDQLQIHIEAELSLGASENLVIELGYDKDGETQGDGSDGETGTGSDSGGSTDSGNNDGGGGETGGNSGEGSDNETESDFIVLRRFENITYQRETPTSENITIEFVCDDLERSFFDEVDKFRLRVPYVNSRGNIAYESASKGLELEEHEAFGFCEIQSELQEILKAVEDGVEVTCTTEKQTWLLDDQVMPLGVTDEFHTQATITTNDRTALQSKLVELTAYAYMESNEEFNVWDGKQFPKTELLSIFNMYFPKADGSPILSDNRLKELYVDGDKIELTDGQFDYPYTLDYDYAGSPTVTAVPTDGSTAVVRDAKLVADDPADEATFVENRQATITVTAENGDIAVYHVDYSFTGNNIATLDELTVGGSADAVGSERVLDPDPNATEGSTIVIDVPFDPSQQAYHKFYDDETDPGDLPGLAAKATDDSNAVVTYPDDETYNDAGFPVKKFVKVTAQDRTTTMIYSVLFAPEGWTEEDEAPEEGNNGGNANRGTKTDLEVLAIDNQMVDEFAADTLSYDVLLPETTRSLPLVTAVAEDADAVIEHIKPARLPGQYKIRVKGKKVDPDDPENLLDDEKTYVLNMDVEGLPDGEFIELGAVPVTGISGIWLPPTSDYFVLARTSSQIRFWTSEHLLAPKFKIFVDTPGFNPTAPASEPLATVTTDQLKKSGGGGKHSKSTVDNGDGGYYKYNLKGRNLPNLVVGEHYVLVLFNGDNPVFFGPGDYAMLHFEMGEQVKGSVDHRNRDLNTSGRGSNIGTNQ